MTHDKVIEGTKSASTNFNEKNVTCETQNLYILLGFLLIIIPLLIADEISSKKNLCYHFVSQTMN